MYVFDGVCYFCLEKCVCVDAVCGSNSSYAITQEGQVSILYQNISRTVFLFVSIFSPDTCFFFLLSLY